MPDFIVRNNRINDLVDEMSLNKCNPSKSILDNALSLDIVDELPSLGFREITNCIVVLSQYLISLTYKTNTLRVSKSLLSKYLEDEVNRNIKNTELSGNKDEKRRQLIDGRSDLIEAEKELENLSCELLMLDGFHDSITEYINALKKHRDSLELETKHI